MSHKNTKGAIDVYGRLRITYSRIGKGKRNNDEKLENFKKASSAIKDLAGSRAHLAWPKRAKGEILFLLGRNQEALDTLLDAEKEAKRILKK